MKAPILVSTTGHIGDHRIKGELELVRVRAEAHKEGVATSGPFTGFFNGFTRGVFEPRFSSYNEALDLLKDEVRRLGGNAVINVRYDSSSDLWIEGFAVIAETIR